MFLPLTNLTLQLNIWGWPERMGRVEAPSLLEMITLDFIYRMSTLNYLHFPTLNKTGFLLHTTDLPAGQKLSNT